MFAGINEIEETKIPLADYFYMTSENQVFWRRGLLRQVFFELGNILNKLNIKTIIEFGFRTIWRIIGDISDDVFCIILHIIVNLASSNNCLVKDAFCSDVLQAWSYAVYTRTRPPKWDTLGYCLVECKYIHLDSLLKRN